MMETTPGQAEPVRGCTISAPCIEHDPQRGLTVTLRFRAQSYDIDFNGHVSNIAYLRWLEDLRLALLDATIPLAECLNRGYSPVIAETFIRYRRPVHLGDNLTGSIWLGEHDECFFTTHLELSRGGEVVAVSEQKLCFASMETHRAVPIPPEFRRHVGWGAA